MCLFFSVYVCVCVSVGAFVRVRVFFFISIFFYFVLCGEAQHSFVIGIMSKSLRKQIEIDEGDDGWWTVKEWENGWVEIVETTAK